MWFSAKIVKIDLMLQSYDHLKNRDGRENSIHVHSKCELEKPMMLD
jgi:hypothetical protein